MDSVLNITSPHRIPILLAIWLTIHYVGLGIGYLSTRKIICNNIGNNPKFNSWIIFNTDNEGNKFFKIWVSYMTKQDRVVYLIHTLWVSLIMFAYGNIPNKMNSFFDLFYLIPIYLMIPLFGFLGQVKALSNFSISPDYIRNMPLAGKITFTLLALLCTSLVSYHFYLAYLANELIYYILGVVFIPLFYTYLYKFWLQNYYADYNNSHAIIGYDDDEQQVEKPNWHIHHWFVGFYFSLLFRYDTLVSQLAFSIFYGVFLEGAWIEGPLPIII